MRDVLKLAHGDVLLPAFLPDATQGVVRGVDAQDLESVGVEALVMSVFHLMQKPGSSNINALGGLHKMTGWRRPIITDSGGFQAYSYIRQNAKFGKLSDQGIRFRPENGDREFLLTPEKSIQLQMSYGADLLICLDDCTHVDDSASEQALSLDRTIKWAKRCKVEFTRLLEEKQRSVSRSSRKVEVSSTLSNPDLSPLSSSPPPLLYGVVQGGGEADLRRRCAEALLEIGFDGYGYGGWPLDSEGKLVSEMLALTRELISPEFPMHALGVGHPQNVLQCARMGYDTFDSALPTRDARTGRLYTFLNDPGKTENFFQSDWFKYLYIDDEKYIKADRPISPGCDCLACTRYSLGYLRHLHKCGDTLFYRLATLHNLRYMMQLMAMMRI